MDFEKRKIIITLNDKEYCFYYSCSNDATFQNLLEFFASLVPTLNICQCYQFYKAKDKKSNNLQIAHNSKIVEYNSDEDEIGMFDTVTFYNEDDDENITVTIVTSLRNDVLSGRISNKSPLGSSILGHREGERVLIKVNDNYSYYVKILSIEKGFDDDSLTIN